MLNIRMAFRNIFRYKKRSLITAFAIAVGVMFTIAIDGLLAGSEQESSRNIRDFETGEAKIYPEGYFTDRLFLPFSFFLEKEDRAKIEQSLAGYKAAPRVELSAELYFNEDYFAVPGSTSAKISCVDPVRDGTVFKTAYKIDEGRWLKSGDEGIVIGSWLAADIGAKTGYVLSVECKGRGGFYQTFDAEIIGIVTTEDPYVNRASVFMDLSRADDLLQLGGAVTEYTVRLDKTPALKELKAAMPSYAKNIYSWEQVAADLIKLTKTKSGMSKLYLMFMFIIAAVGISNTMLMAVMERKNEIGMMRALGYSSFRIRLLFLIEGFGIGLLGASAGLAAGCVINFFMSVYGIDFSSLLRNMDAGYRITGIMRSSWNWEGIGATVIGSLAISTFVAWFPSGKILKSEVAEILRK